MGVLKILVLFAVVFAALCEETKKTQVKSATIIKTRCKRETEMDMHSRERKVPICRKLSRPLVPVTKRLNPINVYPYKNLPRRNMVPVVIKPKVLNTTEDSVKNSDVINLNNGNKSVDGPGLGTIEPCEPNQTTNLTTIDNLKNNDESINEEIKEKFAIVDSKLTTPIKDVQNNEDKHNEKKYETVVDKDIKNENVKQVANKDVDKVTNQVITNEVKIPLPNSVENPLSTNLLLTDFKVVPGIERSSKPVGIENKPIIKENESRENIKNSKTDITTESLSLVNNGPENKEVNGNVAPKIVPLTNLTDAGKIPIQMVPRLNPLQVPLITNPTTKLTNEYNVSVDMIPVKNVETPIRTQINKFEPDITIASPKSEQEEILIQNNNYEELYEVATPQYSTPKLIASDLRSVPTWNNFNAFPSLYEKYNVPNANDDKSYSYKVEKYPNQFVVNTYDDTENKRQYNNIDYSLDSNMNNQDNSLKLKYTKTENPWSQRCYNYNQPQTENLDQRSSIENYYQRQENPKIIWRSWKNNQVFIKPKYGSAVNTELYKGLGRYLANANAQGTPVYTSNRIGSSAHGNQNTSPYVNPFQYKCYGY